MGATTIGVIISEATGVALRTITPDDVHGDAFLLDPARVRPGEKMLIINRADLPQSAADPYGCVRHLDVTIPVIAEKHGIVVTRGIPHNIVDETGKVVNTIMACPVLAQAALPPGHKLVRVG